MASPPILVRFVIRVQNKNIGFVYPGQTVTIKVVTFLYTRCGTLSGTVSTFSYDVVHDKKLGLALPTRIHLKTNHIRVEID